MTPPTVDHLPATVTDPCGTVVGRPRDRVVPDTGTPCEQPARYEVTAGEITVRVCGRHVRQLTRPDSRHLTAHERTTRPRRRERPDPFERTHEYYVAVVKEYLDRLDDEELEDDDEPPACSWCGRYIVPDGNGGFICPLSGDPRGPNGEVLGPGGEVYIPDGGRPTPACPECGTAIEAVNVSGPGATTASPCGHAVPDISLRDLKSDAGEQLVTDGGLPDGEALVRLPNRGTIKVYHTDPECRLLDRTAGTKRVRIADYPDCRECRVCADAVDHARKGGPNGAVYQALIAADPDDLITDGGHKYICRACGAGFETLTEKRLHQKDDCPNAGRAILPPADAERAHDWIVSELEDVPTTGTIGFGMDTNGESIVVEQYHDGADAVDIGSFEDGWITVPAETNGDCPACGDDVDAPALVHGNDDRGVILMDCLECRSRTLLVDDRTERDVATDGGIDGGRPVPRDTPVRRETTVDPPVDVGPCRRCGGPLGRYALNVVSGGRTGSTHGRRRIPDVLIGSFRCAACDARGDVVRSLPARASGVQRARLDRRLGPALSTTAAIDLDTALAGNEDPRAPAGEDDAPPDPAASVAPPEGDPEARSAAHAPDRRRV